MPVKVIFAEMKLKTFEEIYDKVKKFKNSKSESAYSFVRYMLDQTDYTQEEKTIIVDLLIDFINI